MPATSKTFTTLALVVGLSLAAAACSDDNDDTTSTTESTTSTTDTTTTTESTTSTTDSSTSESTTSTTGSTTTESTTTTTEPTISIDYVCANGDTGSAEFTTDDEDQIDDFVNGTDLCETLGGLTEISFTAECPSGDREVTVGATDGALPDFATIDYCEDDS